MVTQADLDAGHWANTACVDDGAGGAVQACADEDVPWSFLTITKVATEQSFTAVGDILHYTIVATNDGNDGPGGGDGDRHEGHWPELCADQRFGAGQGHIDDVHGDAHGDAGGPRCRALGQHGLRR